MRLQVLLVSGAAEIIINISLLFLIFRPTSCPHKGKLQHTLPVDEKHVKKKTNSVGEGSICKMEATHGSCLRHVTSLETTPVARYSASLGDKRICVKEMKQGELALF